MKEAQAEQTARAIPGIVQEGWDARGGGGRLLEIREISARVSTNRVYRLHLEGGASAVAKVSSYGAFVYFRQDHERIHQWCRALHQTRFRGFLAGVLSRAGRPFLHRSGPAWLALYEDKRGGETLPAVLEEGDIAPLARELAAFHEASLKARLAPTWKSLGSDISLLRTHLESEARCKARGIGPASAAFLREHCDAFLQNVDQPRFAKLPRIPVLVDWNRGNFSIARDATGAPRFVHRWDYDWFRVESRALDFYFFARVVSARGDQSRFTYDAEVFFDPRFQKFLRAYQRVSPLQPAELELLPELYRFFLLNYAVREAEHFFLPAHCETLRRDAVELHLPALNPAAWRARMAAALTGARG